MDQFCSGIPEPLELILTRWETWLKAAILYHAVNSRILQLLKKVKSSWIWSRFALYMRDYTILTSPTRSFEILESVKFLKCSCCFWNIWIVWKLFAKTMSNREGANSLTHFFSSFIDGICVSETNFVLKILTSFTCFSYTPNNSPS